jgi:hypothetical protein
MVEPTFIWELVGLFLTLMVLLYMIFGDNALFRIVSYTFVGVASGYVAALLVFQVLLPRAFNGWFAGNLLLLAPFALGLLLFFKLSSRFAFLGTLPMAMLVGVGAAVAVGGAIFGTLFGQVIGTVSRFNAAGSPNPMAQLLEGLFILVGTISTLAYFQFGTRSRPAAAPDAGDPAAGDIAAGNLAAGAAEPAAPAASARRGLSMELVAKVGQVFIGITLGAMFAGVYTAAITALIERLGFVIDVITQTVGRFF